jgi:hypothetical protein
MDGPSPFCERSQFLDIPVSLKSWSEHQILLGYGREVVIAEKTYKGLRLILELPVLNGRSHT